MIWLAISNVREGLDMGRSYTLLDVFTNTALAGNPLAVVHDGSDLSDEQMLSIAREFNLSETVFVLPSQSPAHTASLRIFTPSGELPFAGHPTVGATIHLAREMFGNVESEQDAIVVVEELIGAVRAGVVLRSEQHGFSEFDLPCLPEPMTSSKSLQKDLIAAALSLEPTEIGFENHLPSRFSAGVPFVLVPIRDLNVARRATPVTDRWGEAFGDDGGAAAFLYCRECERHDAAFHARMFSPNMPKWEDPATGSAVAAFAGAIIQFDQPTDGEHSYLIEQGIEMGRPSLIRLGLSVERGGLHSARIGGDAVVVGQGELFL